MRDFIKFLTITQSLSCLQLNSARSSWVKLATYVTHTHTHTHVYTHTHTRTHTRTHTHTYIYTKVGYVMLDFPALGAVVVLSLVLMRSTRESGLLNVIMVVIHLVLILFVMCAGGCRSLWRGAALCACSICFLSSTFQLDLAFSTSSEWLFTGSVRLS